eukprot:TRINITY_DN111_c0_g1_i1.p1 TRINITY_DN111_c0_g1~~TRINITY_DN111_c0_g1_i1.p1  ORF type:complete len:529 (+),score=220.23 TRINITY_DN111_c0_g1_i1:106-1587(+)
MAQAETAEELKQQGNEAFRSSKYSEAVGFYSSALELDPTNYTLYSNRAAAHIALKQHAEADADCAKVLEIDPKSVKAHGRRAKARWLAGDLSEASRMYEHTLVLEPKNTDAKQSLAMIAELRKSLDAYDKAFLGREYALARSFINKLLFHSPTARSFLVRKAECNVYLEPEVAARDLRDLLVKDGDDLDVLALRGKALLYAGNSDMATQHWRSCLSRDPDNTTAAKLLRSIRKFEKLKQEGNDFFKARSWAEAETRYTECLAVDPHNKRMNAVVYNNRAAARKELGQLSEAESDCSAAIARDESMVKAWLRRSRILQDLERWDDAVRDMEQAAELDQANGEELRTLKRRAKLAKRKNFYKILGVARDAEAHEIKRAYRKLAMEWHPDKWQSADQAEREKAEAKFKEVGEAFSILSDTQKRRRYDMGILDNDSECGEPGYGYGGMDPFEMFMASGGSGMRGGHHRSGHGGYGRHPFYGGGGCGGPFAFEPDDGW